MRGYRQKLLTDRQTERQMQRREGEQTTVISWDPQFYWGQIKKEAKGLKLLCISTE